MPSLVVSLMGFLAPASRSLVISKQTGNRCVVILGWGGSKVKNLSRIREFYSSQASVRTVVSFSMPLWAPEFARKHLISHLCDEVASAKTEEVLVHSFSNNGTWAYGEMSQELSKRRGDDSKRNTFHISKLVIDSAPYYYYEPIGLAKSVAEYQPVILSVLLNKAVYHHNIYTPILTAILTVLGGTAQAVYMLPFGLGSFLIPDFLLLSLYLKNDSPAVPTLFLYGNRDRLIPPEQVLDYADALRRRFPPGTTVDTETLDGVQHVAGFFDSSTRDQYKAKVSRHFGFS
jgi:hypothetical protein